MNTAIKQRHVNSSWNLIETIVINFVTFQLALKISLKEKQEKCGDFLEFQTKLHNTFRKTA